MPIEESKNLGGGALSSLTLRMKEIIKRYQLVNLKLSE